MTWNPRDIPSQRGKTFVVTGGNAGIGYFISEQLASAGARVIIASRNAAKGTAAMNAIREQVPGATLQQVTLDLASFESIRAAAAQLSTLGTLDGIIQNAGAVMPSSKRQVTLDGNELMFGTNHLGHFLLTALLYPTLQAAGTGTALVPRVVTMGSGATRLTRVRPTDLQSLESFTAFGAYGRSKHATQSFGFELDRRLRSAGSPVVALVAHPGGAIDQLSPTRTGVIEPTRLQRIAATNLQLFGGGKDRAAWSAVRAATDKDATGGQYYGPRGHLSGPPVLQSPVAASHGAEFGGMLWAASEEITGQVFAV